MHKKKGLGIVWAVFLVVVIVAGVAGIQMVKKYMPSKEQQDLNEYFGVSGDELAIILDGELLEDKAMQVDGSIYFSLNLVKDVFNNRFYYDYNEDILIYTMPTEVRYMKLGDTGYCLYKNLNKKKKVYEENYGVQVVLKENDQVYINAQVMMEYLYDIGSFQVYGNPGRVVISHIEFLRSDSPEEDSEEKYAAITKHTVLRRLGGVKSPILRDLEQGESVIIGDNYDKWTQVTTEDGFTGYVKSKYVDSEAGEAFACAETREQPEFTNQLRDKKINLAWHQSTNLDANAKLEEVISGCTGINVISPTWFALSDNEGNFTSLGENWYVDTLHAKGIEVWGLISNFEKTVDTGEILSHSSKRNYLIRNLIKQSKDLGLDGINLDFEQISSDYGDDYIQFVRELSVACRNDQLVLSIDNYVPTGYTAHYNRKEQGIFADYVIIMGYDEHYSGSETAGSVASIGFVKDGIEMTLAEVPAEKVINAIPFYTRIWKETVNEDGVVEVSSEAAGMERVEKLLSDLNVEAGWNEECAQFYAEYELEGATYKIWMENEISIEEKMKLIQENHLAGVAEWKLGLQKNTVWDVINKYLTEYSTPIVIDTSHWDVIN
ncbi:MAG: chitinase [Lachnospiraceae bacterium]|nr:chitinase [Lachnospiraceae bacterium]